MHVYIRYVSRVKNRYNIEQDVSQFMQENELECRCGALTRARSALFAARMLLTVPTEAMTPAEVCGKRYLIVLGYQKRQYFLLHLQV